MSIEAEQQLVAFLLINHESCDEIIEIVKPSMLSDGFLSDIYAALVGNYTQGNKNSVSFVVDALNVTNEDEIEGIADLVHFADTPNALGYAKSVFTRWAKDVMANSISDYMSDVYDQSPEYVLEQTQKLAATFEEMSRSDEKEMSWKEQIRETLRHIDRLSKLDDHIVGQRTGIESFDEKLGGMKDANLLTIAGRPGMGKSTLAWQIFLAGAMTNPDRFYLGFTLEMPFRELHERFFSQVSNVFLDKISKGKLNDFEFDKVAASVAAKMATLDNLHIHDLSGPRPEMIYKLIRQRARKQKMGMVVIDAPYLCKTSDGDLRHILSGMTKTLKAMAKDLGCPVVVLHQLSKECERRPNKRPMLSDLKETGGFEEDSDVVIFIYRDEVYNEDSAMKGCAELKIAKNRQGATGTIPVKAQLNVNRFTDFEAGDYNPYAQERMQ